MKWKTTKVSYNQTPIAKLAQEWRYAHLTSKGMYARSEVNFYSYSWSSAQFLPMLVTHPLFIFYTTQRQIQENERKKTF
jgi:hypothetical protein